MPKPVSASSQLRGIHQSMLIFSKDADGIFPTPGLIDRLPLNGAEQLGRGAEDISKNTTAALYSLMIMRNYFTPEFCVGPTEPSPHVKVFGDGSDDYDYDSYAVIQGVYWDPNFRADLHDVSHVSYAHMPICGSQKLKQWRDTLSSTFPILGDRGPLNGVADPNSITNKIHPPLNSWDGYVVFNDNSTALFDTFYPNGSADNTFAWDYGTPCEDAMLTFTKQMTPDGPVIEHD